MSDTTASRNSVRPISWGSSDRVYNQYDNKILCLTIEERPKLLFAITLPSKEHANIIMEDLYYGEHTGG